eukprot:3647103-Heterocapsa_arctica.AAC.1
MRDQVRPRHAARDGRQPPGLERREDRLPAPPRRAPVPAGPFAQSRHELSISSSLRPCHRRRAAPPTKAG